MGEARHPLLRDDNGSRFCDPVDMEAILSHLEFAGWIFSAVGLLTVLVISGLLLSGLPGAILRNIEVTASARRTIHHQQAPGSKATSHRHRERMGA